jgi:hypothetical protein
MTVEFSCSEGALRAWGIMMIVEAVAPYRRTLPVSLGRMTGKLSRTRLLPELTPDVKD